MMCLYYIIIFIYFNIINIFGLQIPSNPCPIIFEYRLRQDGIYYGQLNIPYNGERILDLSVNVSMIGYYKNAKLKLEMLTPQNDILNHQIINYAIHFPFVNVLPKLTQVLFNNQILCAGPPESLGMGGVTNIWANVVFRIRTYTYTVRDGIDRQPPQHIKPQITETTTIKTTTTPEPSIEVQLSKNPFFNAIGNDKHPKTTSTTTTTTITTTQPSTTTGLIGRVQSTTKKPSTINNHQECGIANDIQTLVVNGEHTLDNEYPWLVALFYRQGITYQFQCTANLISRSHVITAAHCVQFHRAPLVPHDDMLLILGRSNLTHWAAGAATIRTVATVLVHPDYRQFSGHCDVAVIRMNEPVSLSASVRPVCLWDEQHPDLDAYVNQDGVVCGWGRDERERQNVPELRRVRMPIVSQEECLRSNHGFFNLTSDKTFCAGERNGSGPCTGDSGAGFMIKQSDNRWHLRGLVSTAIKDDHSLSCNLKEYVVFSDVAKLTGWIKQCLKK